jgi:hypothetical protein
MISYAIYEYDTTTNKSIPISGHIYSLGNAYDRILGDKEGGVRRIIRFPDEVCVWSTIGEAATNKMTKNEKNELAEHMCEFAQHMLYRLYIRKPEEATINWIDPLVKDTVTAQFPDCQVYPSEEYTPTQMYFILEHVFNEFIALNSYKLYYHKLHSEKMHFVENIIRRDPLNPLIKQEQYMAVFKKGPEVYRYFVTRGAGPFEVINLNEDAEPFNKKLSNIVNVVMGSVCYPTFSDEE